MLEKVPATLEGDLRFSSTEGELNSRHSLDVLSIGWGFSHDAARNYDGYGL